MSAFVLPKLKYDYDALEPYMDARTVEIHYGKHHATYVNNLNKALEGHDNLKDKSIEDLLSHLDEVPEEIRTAVRNNGGGHYCHSLFWEVMGPGGGGEPKGEIAEAIKNTFGSFESFKEKLSQAAITRFGSGYGWLVLDGKELQVMSTQNQDTPLKDGKTPLLVVDVWEHAYYLKYQNRRPEYIENWWNLVNWDKVNEIYVEAVK